MHPDDAFDFFVGYLAGLPEPKPDQRASHNDRPHGCDVWVPNVVHAHWRSRGHSGNYDINHLPEDQVRPLYDAAWELCRKGVLRPGHVVPKGQAMGTGFAGDGFSLTAFGRQWLKDATRGVSDPGRLAEVLGNFGKEFGPGYRQRAAEAVRCYRTSNHLAACVLAGAAAESIMLAVAIRKSGGDEEKVLAQYKGSGGRGRVLNSIIGNVPTGISSQFQNASQVLHYWRDEAAHGTATTISEIEAHTSLNQLLRLAQFTSDHWDKLTA